MGVTENKETIGCRWVFVIKYHPDGTIEKLKACLVAKRFTQTYGVDYLETFSPVARLNSIRVLMSLVIFHDWPLFQLDVKNVFSYEDLQEDMYMEQPPGFVAHGESGLVLKILNFLYYISMNIYTKKGKKHNP
ncbi:hypothetical protein ACOSP7_006192 [Xanthoceras sorbifolium]